MLLSAVHAARVILSSTLLCAGPIGWRALRSAGEAHRIGLYGFGAAAHLLAQIAVQQRRAVYVSTRPGERAGAGLRTVARMLLGGWIG